MRGGTPMDRWNEALERLEAARRALAAVDVDPTPGAEIPPDARADLERAGLAADRALKHLGGATAEARVGRALTEVHDETKQ